MVNMIIHSNTLNIISSTDYKILTYIVANM